MIDFAKLRAPFPPERISWRVGSTTQDKSRGMALAFIDARDVMERLDDVCSPAGWQCRYSHANGKTVCDIGVKAGEEWVWKADGAGDSDVEAEKGALSDAFKRAAVRFGVGRYLYDVDAPWVALEPAGRSFKIKDSELPKLRALLGGKPAPKESADKTDNARLDAEAWVAGATFDVQQLTTFPELHEWWNKHFTTIKALPADLKAKVTTVKDAKKTQLQKDAA